MTRKILAALALISSSWPALAFDLAPGARIAATAAGCTCSESGQTWACRKLGQWTCPPKLACSEDPAVPCAWLSVECDALPSQNICVTQDKPK